jgi:hypothetical protein
MEAWRLKIETWRVFRPTVADSHHFEEEAGSGSASKVRSRVRDTKKIFAMLKFLYGILTLKI